MFDALADLAVASRRDEVRAQARQRAERIMADTEAEIGRCDQRWRDAWQAALAAGWTAAQLRAEPINMAPPLQPVDAAAGMKPAATNTVEPTASPSTEASCPVP